MTGKKYYFRVGEGICPRCGKQDDLIAVYDNEAICAECFDSDFTQCDECGEYWEDSVEFFITKDGKYICEYCAEDRDPENFED